MQNKVREAKTMTIITNDLICVDTLLIIKLMSDLIFLGCLGIIFIIIGYLLYLKVNKLKKLNHEYESTLNGEQLKRWLEYRKKI